MVAGFIYIVFGLIELLLGARFILLLVGVNSASPLVSWIYAWSGPFAEPFASVFGQHVTVAGPGVVTQSVFAWTTLIALVIYAIIGGILVRILASL